MILKTERVRVSRRLKSCIRLHPRAALNGQAREEESDEASVGLELRIRNLGWRFS